MIVIEEEGSLEELVEKMDSLTGYGPQTRTLHFDVDVNKYEEWECKFLAYMHLKKLKRVILPDGGQTTALKLEEAYSELVQVLDSRSLNLIMRDAQNDGREALKILREHYAGRSKQRIVSLYKSLCNLKKEDNTELTDYIIKAESAAAALRMAGEVVSDGLLQSMVLNGLPNSYNGFEDIITQREKVMTFADFKVAIRNYEENRRPSTGIESQFSSIMKVQNTSNRRWREGNAMEQRMSNNNSNSYNNNGDSNPNNSNNNHNGNRSWNQRNWSNSNARSGRNGYECYTCGEYGHKFFECTKNVQVQSNLNQIWCDHCESSKHTYQSCRNRINTKDGINLVRAADSTDGEEHSFVFGVQNGKLCSQDIPSTG